MERENDMPILAGLVPATRLTGHDEGCLHFGLSGVYCPFVPFYFP